MRSPSIPSSQKTRGQPWRHFGWNTSGKIIPDHGVMLSSPGCAHRVCFINLARILNNGPFESTSSFIHKCSRMEKCKNQEGRGGKGVADLIWFKMTIITWIKPLVSKILQGRDKEGGWEKARNMEKEASPGFGAEWCPRGGKIWFGLRNRTRWEGGAGGSNVVDGLTIWIVSTERILNFINNII